MLNVPLAMWINCLNEAGYVGEDIESILTRLLQAAKLWCWLKRRRSVFSSEIR